MLHLFLAQCSMYGYDFRQEWYLVMQLSHRICVMGIVGKFKLYLTDLMSLDVVDVAFMTFFILVLHFLICCLSVVGFHCYVPIMCTLNLCQQFVFVLCEKPKFKIC